MLYLDGREGKRSSHDGQSHGMQERRGGGNPSPFSGQCPKDFLSQFDHAESLSPDVLFMRATKALNLSSIQRAGVLTFLECRDSERPAPNLKFGSIRLFGQYVDINTDSKNDQEMCLTEEFDPASESYVLGKTGKCPSRNRPGYEVSAIGEATLYSNIPNGALVVGQED